MKLKATNHKPARQDVKFKNRFNKQTATQIYVSYQQETPNVNVYKQKGKSMNLFYEAAVWVSEHKQTRLPNTNSTWAILTLLNTQTETLWGI